MKRCGAAMDLSSSGRQTFCTFSSSIQLASFVFASIAPSNTLFLCRSLMHVRLSLAVFVGDVLQLV